MRNKFDEQLKRLHVELIQMGAACEDAISAAADFGIRAERAVRFKADGAGVKLNYATVSAAVSEMRVSGYVSDDWAAEI